MIWKDIYFDIFKEYDKMKVDYYILIYFDFDWNVLFL